MLVSSRRAADGSEMREWQKQRTERQARLAAGSSYASGKVVAPENATALLEAIIRPGDRVCLEGDNQKQADFLAEVLAGVAPSKIHDLHIVQSGIVLQAHLDLFERDIARKLDFSYSGPQGAALARALVGGKIELGAVHTYIELFARYFMDLTPHVALIVARQADRDGNLYTGPNTEDTPTIVEATAFKSGIVVEVALVQGLATAIPPLLARETDEKAARARAARADTAIFYSISNCQDGLRGISFGNFLIKQVVEELQAEFPQLKRFSTLSPIPGFRRWLMQRLAQASDPDAALLPELERDGWWHDLAQSERLRPALMRLCALYLTRQPSPGSRIDPVARFHLGNGARLERINWLGNAAPRAIQESFGIMVNYLYDHDSIEDNHEAFVRDGTIVRSPDVDALLGT